MDNDLKWLAENLEEWEYDDYNLVRLDPAQRLWYAKEEKRIYPNRGPKGVIHSLFARRD